jgi:type II secretory pathway pseudopilin PulG
MTLLELTVVILVLLSLISILFMGARAWKKGSDRTACLLNIRNLQNAVRSYANINGLNPNSEVDLPGGLRGQIIGPGKFLEKEPACPGGLGTYKADAANTIPDLGVLYATCPNIATLPDHAPSARADW